MEGHNYDVYSKFADDDNVPASTLFIIINVLQNNEDLPLNDYINVLIHNQAMQPAWKGNVLVFKINPL